MFSSGVKLLSGHPALMDASTPMNIQVALTRFSEFIKRETQKRRDESGRRHGGNGIQDQWDRRGRYGKNIIITCV